MQRPVDPAPARITAMPARVPAFHALVIWQDIRIGPPPRAAFLPMVKIHRMTAHINHAIDRRRPANDLAARTGQPPAPQMRFGLRLVAPVIHLHVHRVAERRRHLNERPRVRPAVFNHDHAPPRRGQPVGHRAARAACSDNYKFRLHHIPHPVFQRRHRDALLRTGLARPVPDAAVNRTTKLIGVT